MLVRREWMLLAVLLTAPMATATGNVITDWDEKAIALVQPGTVFPPPTALRTTAMLHLAMFEAVNSIEPRYRPYGVQLAVAPDTSQEAAAASAAGAVLMELVPNAAAQIQAAETSYLAKLPDDAAKSAGIKLGQEAAAKILAMRANDSHIDQRPRRVFISRLRSRSAGHSRGSGHSLWRALRSFGPSPRHRSPAPCGLEIIMKSRNSAKRTAPSAPRDRLRTHASGFQSTPACRTNSNGRL